MAREWNLGLKDDRGAPFTLGDLAAGVRHDRKGGRRVVAWMQVLGYAGMAFAVWRLATGAMSVTAWNVVVWGVVWGLFGLALVLSWRYGTPGLRRRVWGPRAWACAHGCCGGCGYALREVTPGEDGCVACPECGAAWHRDRWTMAGRDLLENRRFVGMLQGVVSVADIDDRGVPCDASSGWFSPWAWSDRVDAAVRQAVRDEIAGRAWLRFAVGAAGVGVAWVAGICVFLAVRNPLPQDWWLDLMFFSIVTALIGATIGYLLFRIAGRARDRRAASLRVSRCVNCGDVLAAAPGFDGCVACGGCGRAWRWG